MTKENGFAIKLSRAEHASILVGLRLLERELRSGTLPDEFNKYWKKKPDCNDIDILASEVNSNRFQIKKKRFRVSISTLAIAESEVLVEARNKNEAKKKAIEQMHDGKIDWSYGEIAGDPTFFVSEE